ncbi:MAG TPA: autotransporter-associated beta strand repeat-containing protein, partial [Gemmatimonadales bacterium]
AGDADVSIGQTLALARATTATWTGAVNNQWTNGGNWIGLGGTPLVGGEDLIFPGGAANLSNTNGLAAATTFNSITITGSGYTLAGNAITLGAGNLADSSVAGANTISLAMAFAATRTVTVSDAGTTLLVSGIISGAGGLTKAGAGMLALSGANTYTGVTTIGAGTIDARSNAALGTTAGATIVSAGATLRINGNGLAIAEPVTLNGTGVGGGGALRNLANNNTISGAVTLASAARINSDAGLLTVSNTISGAGVALTVGGAGNTTISGVIGTTTGSLTKDSTGILLLSAVNTYTGATTVSGGTLRLGIANAVSASSAVTVAAGATLDMNGFSDTIGSLAGAGTVTSGVAGAVTLNAGGNNTSTAFSGVLQNGAGTLAVTKSGTGTWTLSGASTYTGLTTISAGVIDAQSNTALGSAAGATTVATGAALQVDGSGLAIAEPLTLNGTGIANGGALRNLANNNTVSGAITLASASRISSDGGTLTISNNIGGATQALTAAGAGNTTISGVIGTTTGTLTMLGTGTLTLSGNNTYTGLTTVSAGTLLVNGAQGSSAVSLNGGTLGGTGTVGAITSTAAGGTLAPGPAPGTGILNSGNLNLSAGAPAFSVELNGSTAGTSYDQVNVTGTVNLTGSVLGGTMGFAATNGMTFIIIANDGADAVVGTFAGLAEGATTTISGQTFSVSYVGGTGNDVVLTRTAPNLTIGNSVAPPGTASPGTDLTYTVTFTNVGGGAAQSLVIIDSVPGTADFKVGSVTNNLGTTGLSVTVAYSNDGGSTWIYVPASGAGGAPAGYDRLVTHVRWSFTGNLSPTPPNNTAQLTFVARVK